MLWNPHLYRTTLDSMHIYSAVLYSPVAKRIILSAKENGIKAADDLIIHALSHCLHLLLRDFEIGILVPAPSRKSSNRKRGRDFLSELTHSVARNESLDCIDLLVHTRKIRDQSELNAHQRGENIYQALAIDRNKLSTLGVDTDVILVDDLLTTGATLLEARRALEVRGIRVIAAITACLSPPLR
ncbi:MAG: ComF family protein [Actinobacteria bacterium]|nr:ComF family protein [Actinomycetota bacterium]NDA94854.1 ComF family protein [Actinomycetota bacterium]NDH99354.1 ComF family protein [Actinomycetota bacterium]